MSGYRYCLQDRVLSPLLRSIVVNDLREILDAGVFIVGCADNIIVISSGIFEITICEVLQRTLKLMKKCVQ